MKALLKKNGEKFDYWDEIIQVVKVEEPAPVLQIIQAVKKANGSPSFQQIDREILGMARAGVIRRIWIEKEEWRKAEEAFIL